MFILDYAIPSYRLGYFPTVQTFAKVLKPHNVSINSHQLYARERAYEVATKQANVKFNGKESNISLGQKLDCHNKIQGIEVAVRRFSQKKVTRDPSPEEICGLIHQPFHEEKSKQISSCIITFGNGNKFYF